MFLCGITVMGVVMISNVSSSRSEKISYLRLPHFNWQIFKFLFIVIYCISLTAHCKEHVTVVCGNKTNWQCITGLGRRIHNYLWFCQHVGGHISAPTIARLLDRRQSLVGTHVDPMWRVWQARRNCNITNTRVGFLFPNL